ncbi:MAG: FHA domain-containing protein [Candidatus Thiodiazotropha sp. (ex. Lucinisca nassula)]|nr:FHA domain-containing protein [Candidatus Thiodiazotropha sp. (ex. Lucinisca nassula)]MBW9271254.1 FHA domain-containing protein [Candidatus Thiodiazotropha sp. (ex. Lucinisca nassula)]
MKVTLKALTEKRLASIVVNDVLLPIGSNEVEFRDLPENYREQLSERHARIFQDQDTVYVVELGSDQGTTLNGDALGTSPVELADGDILIFGVDLAYKADIEATDFRPGLAESEVNLLLTPSDSHYNLDPVSIQQLPFLIGKEQPALASWAEKQPYAFSFLSRRHAQLSRDGENILIEDLSSTNGTWVNGERERGSTRSLQSGDTIAFGQEGVSFRFELLPVSKTNSLPQGTILVSKADSFLDIYCQSSPGDVETDSENIESEIAQEEQLQQDKRLLQGVNFSRLTKVQKAVAVTLMMACLFVVAYLFNQDDRPKHIQSLLAEGETKQAMLLAQTFLLENPQHVEVRQAMQQAMMASVIPEWLSAYQKQNYSKAIQLIEALQQQLGEGDKPEWAGTLLWVAGAAEFRLATLDFKQTRLFVDETKLSGLLESPTKPASQQTPVMQSVIQKYPDLKPIYHEALSTLRLMKNHANTYLPVIENLKGEVQKALLSDGLSGLAETVQDFSDRYPGINGPDELLRDLERFRRVSAALDEKNLRVFAELRTDLSFKTPIFQKAAKRQFTQLEDAKEMAERFSIAREHWARGEHDLALSEMEHLAAGPWRVSAVELINQWQNHLQEFEVLNSSEAVDLDSTHYANRLSVLYLSLDAVTDKWLRQQVFERLQPLESEIKLLASERLQEAQVAWQSYQTDEGGIDSSMRLEPRVTSRFRRQAEYLQTAMLRAENARELGFFLDDEVQAQADSLYKDISEEAIRQHLALDRLTSVLDPAVVNAKLALIPVPEE